MPGPGRPKGAKGKKEKSAIQTKATPKERQALNVLRDIKLKDLRKGTGPGRPMMPTKGGKLSREQLNKMRDELLKDVRKDLGMKAGRPKKAITQFREKK
mgnify:CR=1 FL=1|tara:strand:- start:457 stop:753 length:297 start_codon:yes stop_codon:yes gene_type:complete